jgi:hypothetical protein
MWNEISLFKRQIWAYSVCIIACFSAINAAFGQEIYRGDVQISWAAAARKLSTNAEILYPDFAGSVFDETAPTRPIWIKKIALATYGDVEAVLTDMRFEAMGFAYSGANIGNNIEVAAAVTYYRGQPQALLQFCPIRRNATTGEYERLISARLTVRLQARAQARSQARTASFSNALATGAIYKISVDETGIHKIDYNFLQGLGVDMSALDPRQIQVFGNGGEPLPELLTAARVDGLLENPIFVQGEQDGRFDAQDYILFYAKGTKNWTFDPITNNYKHQQNIYSDKTYYYIRINNGAGRRVANAPAVGSPTYTSTAYDALQHFEEDKVNLLNQEQPALPPSGREWFGASYKTQRSQTANFNFSNRITSEPIKMRIRAAARAYSNSSFVFSEGGVARITGNTTTISSYVYGKYASLAESSANFVSSSNNLSVSINFNSPSSASDGWLDYISVHARCRLSFVGGQVAFRDGQSYSQAVTRFELANAAANVNVWDVTYLDNIQTMGGSLAGGTYSFNAATVGVLRQFVAFDGSSYLTPVAVGAIANQNLHGIGAPPALVVVYHPLFRAAAEQLVAHRIANSQMTAIAVDVNQIFNEFSSGKADVSAIRDFCKMLYDRNAGTDSLRYLLLMGAGSFDYKNISVAASGNHNFVPLFQTQESLEPLLTYTTDDYFTLLDDNEGDINANQDLDIAVGRITCVTTAQANQVVDKIIRYDVAPDAFQDWRNMVTFVADDEDNNLHFRDAEIVSRIVKNNAPNYNIAKIYIDAYQQQSTGGGGRYPDANDAILRRIFNGSLIMNYIGHGADDGWAQERIFTNSEITPLNNNDKFPLFITATCSFSPHDDPSLTSAGELLLLNSRGGAIALLTTVRVVLADANAHLTRNTFENIFVPHSSGRMPTIGEILMQAKNNSGILSASNSRKYVLLGDPSQTLAYPKYRVVTNQINGSAPQIDLDTLRALQRITITGEVRTPAGALASSFNGVVYPTVFDKVDTLMTRGNDIYSIPAPFPLQSKIIFRGRASVVNGRFTFTFIVPRDINYSFGNGRISYYAADPTTLLDANGNYDGIIIGGTDPNAANDVVGPEVNVFMNDENFAFGSITDANPTLLVKLYDLSGINTVGNSIGHDLSAQHLFPKVSQTTTSLTGETKTYNLNDSYLANIDDFQRGTVRYPLRNLPDGKHTINVEAWDVYNNVGHGNTEFVVASSASIALQHVLNYPNPFTTSTNFQFDHNILNQSLEIQIQIFTIAGNLVKTISETRLSDSYHVRDIHWDGLDDYGQTLARGTYIYKISVRSSSGLQVENSAYQKLVLLR